MRKRPRPIPVCDLRMGDLFYDQHIGEWLRAERSAAKTWITFLDQETGNYEWDADGHRYNAPLTDKHGNTLHIWVMR